MKSLLTLALILAPSLALAKVEHSEGRFQALDGLWLYEQSWKPADGAEPTGAVVIMHGLKDHSARYAELATKLVEEQGLAVYAFDLRGHGRSGGDRVWVESFRDYVDDLKVFVTRTRAQTLGKPLFLMGHSMGGAISTIYALERPQDLNGLILSAAALKVPSDVSSIKKKAARALSKTAPRFPLQKLIPETFSRDPKVVAENAGGDPLISQRKLPARLAAEFLDAIERIERERGRLVVPVAFMHGNADRATNPWGSVEAHAAAASADKSLYIYEGLFHDLTHEPEKDRILGDITEWIARRL